MMKHTMAYKLNIIVKLHLRNQLDKSACSVVHGQLT